MNNWDDYPDRKTSQRFANEMRMLEERERLTRQKRAIRNAECEIRYMEAKLRRLRLLLVTG